jgi:hypothetical protein
MQQQTEREGAASNSCVDGGVTLLVPGESTTLFLKGTVGKNTGMECGTLIPDRPHLNRNSKDRS